MSVEKVTTTKLIENCNLNISQSTPWGTLNRLGYKCRKKSKQLMLTKNHGEGRLQCITQWITEGHNQTETVFSYEKRFSLDDPDSWYTYGKSHETNIRQIRQCEGGSVLVWAMVMPNGLISHKIIRGIFKATDYLCLFKELFIKSILEINLHSKKIMLL